MRFPHETDCRRWEEELALLAGGDDLSPQAEAAASEHAAGCARCAELLAGLRADQDVLAELREAPLEAAELTDVVLARLATLPASPRGARTWIRPAQAAGLAAVAVLVGALALATGLGGPESMPPGLQLGAGGAELSSEAPGADGESLPVRVRRAAGGAVEVTWSGDEREGAAGAGQPYTVLASASAEDFTGARAVEVAGRSLVASGELPATRVADRRITYFRVQ